MSMLSPFKGTFALTSPRGYRTLNGTREYHKGIDLVGKEDATVYAIADGTVYTLYEQNGFGNYIRQHTADGKRIYYGHLKSFIAKGGSFVKKGQPLGVMGATGHAFGEHLHLELRPAGSSSSSLDICEFTKIPNTFGTYCGKPQGEFSKDKTVDMLMQCGIVDSENRENWELMLSGKAPLNQQYVRILFERCCKKLLEKGVSA
ncbi:MAG: M23 family metallopeptidase [Clostridia bacterium]|nr:M23 family metallopeptidase [Clostridia bacterium]